MSTITANTQLTLGSQIYHLVAVRQHDLVLSSIKSSQLSSMLFIQSLWQQLQLSHAEKESTYIPSILHANVNYPITKSNSYAKSKSEINPRRVLVICIYHQKSVVPWLKVHIHRPQSFRVHTPGYLVQQRPRDIVWLIINI